MVPLITRYSVPSPKAKPYSNFRRVLVEGLDLSYHSKETLLLTTDPHYGNLKTKLTRTPSKGPCTYTILSPWNPPNPQGSKYTSSTYFEGSKSISSTYFGMGVSIKSISSTYFGV